MRPTKSYSSCLGSGGRISIRRGGTRGATSCWLTFGVDALAGVPFCSASSSRISSRFGVLNAFWISPLIAVAIAGVTRSPCFAFGRSFVRSASARILPRPHRLLGAGAGGRFPGHFLGLLRGDLSEGLRLIDIRLQRLLNGSKVGSG